MQIGRRGNDLVAQIEDDAPEETLAKALAKPTEPFPISAGERAASLDFDSDDHTIWSLEDEVDFFPAVCAKMEERGPRVVPAELSENLVGHEALE